jgi:transposase
MLGPSTQQLRDEQGVHVISTEEKSSIQALERLHPPLPMQPGKRSRQLQEYEYIRHGSRCLDRQLLEDATGTIIAPSIGQSRTNEDFASHIEKSLATDPDAGWVFVVDQLNIHHSEMLVKLVGGELGIELALESKSDLKLMKAMASRRTFLADRAHRIRFVYTPKYASWLNQIELWFSILARRLLERGSFTCVEDLHRRILEFVEYFNRTMAKPFKWPYMGRPLKV